MEQIGINIKEEFVESTTQSEITVSVIEDVPSLTVATIVGVTVVVLMAIAAVFLLGVLIDCRQQRLLARKMGEIRRLKTHRRANVPQAEVDGTSIVSNMEEPSMTTPPAEQIRNIP